MLLGKKVRCQVEINVKLLLARMSRIHSWSARMLANAIGLYRGAVLIVAKAVLLHLGLAALLTRQLSLSSFLRWIRRDLEDSAENMQPKEGANVAAAEKAWDDLEAMDHELTEAITDEFEAKMEVMGDTWEVWELFKDRLQQLKLSVVGPYFLWFLVGLTLLAIGAGIVWLKAFVAL